MLLLEKLIGAFSPETRLRRLRASRQTALLEQSGDAVGEMRRRFEAASTGRRTQGWLTRNTSPNAELLEAGALLRQRSHDLTNNVPNANSCIRKLEAALVGTGIRPCIVPASKTRRSKTDADTMREIWKTHAEKRHIDADGVDGIYGLQSLVARALVEDGEVLVRRRVRLLSDPLPLPLQIQVLPIEHLDTGRNENLAGGGRIVQGIELDPIGRRVGYWIFRTHPHDYSVGFEASRRVPASEVLHVFRRDRPGALRAVPWGSSSMIGMKEADTYADAELLKQTVSSSFAAFVHDINGDNDGEFSNEAQDAQGNPLVEIQPGSITHLAPGRTIEVIDPPSNDGYKDFMDVNDHKAAAGFGVPYEAMTGDLRSVSFTSGRMGQQTFFDEMKAVRARVMVLGFCDLVWDWLNDAAIVAGRISAAVPCTWTPPRKVMLDPSREVKARLLEVRSGFMSLSQAIREAGQEPEAVLEEIAADRKVLEELGLMLESDVSAVAAPGSPVPSGGAAAGGKRTLEEIDSILDQLVERMEGIRDGLGG